MYEASNFNLSALFSSFDLDVLGIVFSYLGAAVLTLFLAVAKREKPTADKSSASDSFDSSANNGTHLIIIGITGASIALAICFYRLYTLNKSIIAFNGYITEDYASLLFALVIAIGTIISICLSGIYLTSWRGKFSLGELNALILFSAAGASIMVQSIDLMSLFIGLEIMSLAVYALTAYRVDKLSSQEAGLKYFLYGAVASAVLIYGIALLYGSVGSTNYSHIQQQLANTAVWPKTVWLAFVFILSAMAFKIAAVPFHMWAPDAYEGAPTAITSFMAIVVKTAAFGALIRFLFFVISPIAIPVVALEIIAIITMFIGNILAIRQDSLKRMLAYSSIAHAGYILVAVVSGLVQPAGSAVSAILWYLLSYTFMTAGAFGIIMLFEKDVDQATETNLALSSLHGLAKKFPAHALIMAIFMFSLGGIPPFAGFFGKFYLFSTAIEAGKTPLVIIAVVNSVIAMYYYLRVVVAMYLSPQQSSVTPMRSHLAHLGIGISVLAVIILGLAPDLFLQFTQLTKGLFY